MSGRANRRGPVEAGGTAGDAAPGADASAARVSGPAARPLAASDLAQLLDRRSTRGAVGDQLLRALIEASPLAIWVLDLEGNVLLWNPSAERLTGWTADEALGRPLATVPREAHDDFRALLARARAGEPLVDVELRRRRKDGSAVTWSLSAAPIRDHGGHVVALVAMAADATERTRGGADAARRLLADARAAADRTARLQAVTAGLARALTPEEVAETVVREGMASFQARSGILCLTSDDGRWLEIVRAVGLPEETARQWRRFALDSPVPLSEAVRSGEPLFLESKAAIQARYPIVREATARAATESWVALPLLSGGAPLGGLAFGFLEARSFTPEDRALGIALAQQCAQALERARLYESERRARAAAERLQFLTAALSEAATQPAVGDAVMRHGVTALGAWAGVIALETEDGAELELLASVGYPAEACMSVGRRWPASASIPIAEAARTGEAVFVESPAAWGERYLGGYAPKASASAAWAAIPLTVDGRARGALLWTYDRPRPFAGDERALMQAIARQCSQALERARLLASERLARQEAEQARERADEANRAKTEFLAVMSHELRTPLNAIAGYAELLDIGVHGPLAESQREAIGRIQRNQRHLLGLINDILNFARIDAGHVELALLAVPMHETLAALEGLVAPQVRGRQLHYSYEPCDPAVTARADVEKLRQILLNLLSNAIKFTEPGGRIAVSCACDDATVRVAVGDSGRGIPADKLERIFEPFVQLDTGRTRTHEGTGLGLAISRELARAMGGTLVAASEVGAGATFTLTLPRAQGSGPRA